MRTGTEECLYFHPKKLIKRKEGTPSEFSRLDLFKQLAPDSKVTFLSARDSKMIEKFRGPFRIAEGKYVCADFCSYDFSIYGDACIFSIFNSAITLL
jgi:hypothetical protein